jgi:hypothetical protein
MKTKDEYCNECLAEYNRTYGHCHYYVVAVCPLRPPDGTTHPDFRCPMPWHLTVLPHLRWRLASCFRWLADRIERGEWRKKRPVADEGMILYRRGGLFQQLFGPGTPGEDIFPQSMPRVAMDAPPTDGCDDGVTDDDVPF